VTAASAAGNVAPAGRRVLLAGATGLVGRECLALLAADPSVSAVTALVRRPPADRTGHGNKVRFEQVDFDRLEARRELFAVDQALCALGTTIRQAGTREAFRRVDLDYPLAVARLAREQGARHFLLVSALGASARSRVFYSRVKGKLEEAIMALGYPALTIVRPSLLLGDRDEFRLGEEIAKRLAWMAPAAYKPVPARDVAAALVDAARADRPGRRIIASGEIGRDS
jgi:uncharacterized protein YbjT (DUF2867 family)